MKPNVARPVRPRRPWLIPLGLARDPAASEPFEGHAVLGEVPGPTGYLLFMTLRDVLLWTASRLEIGAGARRVFAPGAQEARLEGIGAEGDEALRTGLALVAEVLREDEDADAEVVRDGCLRLARWAAGGRAPGTALAFARAAAGVAPRDPNTALEVGRMARGFGRARMAGEWALRALRLAGRAEDRRAYAGARLELAELLHAQGDAERAWRAAYIAVLTARRYGVPEVRGAGYRILADLSLKKGELALADRYVTLAEKWLASAARVEPLRLEILLRRGKLADALAGMPRIESGAVAPEERVRLLGALVRAVGATGDALLIQAAWTEALGIAERMGESAEAARLYLELARAAEPFLPFERVASAARWARALARQAALRGEDAAEVAEAAERLLQPRDSGAGPPRRTWHAGARA